MWINIKFLLTIGLKLFAKEIKPSEMNQEFRVKGFSFKSHLCATCICFPVQGHLQNLTRITLHTSVIHRSHCSVHVQKSGLTLRCIFNLNGDTERRVYHIRHRSKIHSHPESKQLLSKEYNYDRKPATFIAHTHTHTHTHIHAHTHTINYVQTHTHTIYTHARTHTINTQHT